MGKPSTITPRLLLTVRPLSMESDTVANKLRNAAKLASIAVLAFFVYGLATIKTTLRVQKVKNDVEIEIAHTPNEHVRWIYLSGTSPVFTTGSLIQSDGL